MKKDIVIAPKYKGAEKMVDTILDDFENGGGEVLQNGENEIRKFIIDGHIFVIKKFSESGILGKLTSIFKGSKAKRAFNNATQFRHLGYNTPHEVAYAGNFYVCKYTNAQPIALRTSDPENFSRGITIRLAHYLGRMHDMGIIQHELTAQNVLFTKDNDTYNFELVGTEHLSFHKPGTLSRTACFKNISKWCRSGHMFSMFLREYVLCRNIGKPTVDLACEKAKAIKAKIDR